MNATLFQPEQLDDLLRSVRIGVAQRHIIGISVASSFALVVYDHFLTFGDEVNEIWKHPSNPATITLLAVRYFIILNRTIVLFIFFDPGWTYTVCVAIMKLRLPAIAFAITMMLVHVIMVLRVYALYGENPYVLILPGILLITEVLCLSIPMYFVTMPAMQPDSLMHVDCLLRRPTGSVYGAYWIPSLLLDTVIIILTIRKSREYLESTVGTRISILRVFQRDGFMFYLVIVLAHVVNMILFAAAPSALKTGAASFSGALSTMIASRLVLNLRKQRFASGGPDNTVLPPGAVQTSTRNGVVNFSSLLSVGTFFDARLRHSDHESLQLGQVSATTDLAPPASV